MKLDGAKSGWHYTNIDAVYGKNLRMSTPSKSQSSVMGGEDYFVLRERMKKRLQENDWQMQTLFCQTKRLKEKNEEF